MSQKKPKHPQNNPAPKPKENSGKEESTKRHVYVESGVQIDLVESLREKYDTAQSDDASHNKKVLFWTKVSAVLLFIVIVIYYFQLRAMIDAVIATRQASEREQRAWFSAKAIPEKIDPVHFFTYPLRIDNFGKTPGRKVDAVTWLEILPSSESPDLTGHETKYGAGFEHEVGEIVPGDHIELQVDRRKPGMKGTPDIWPTDDTEQADIISGKKYVVVYAKVTYWDVFKVQHWTQLCLWRSNAIGNKTYECSQYNRTDEADEP
jgi:hypothetical protein